MATAQTCKGTSKRLESGIREAPVEESRPTLHQTRTAIIDIADSQTDSTVSSKDVFQRKILSEPRTEISSLQERAKRMKLTSQNSANEMQMSVINTTECEAAMPLLSRKSVTISGRRSISEPSTPHIGKGVALVAQAATLVYI
jgi:hypothetical protein